MTDRPILFTAAMVRALLDGSKTQTRRVALPKLQKQRPEGLVPSLYRCPYGVAGDRLWVREAWRYERCDTGLAVRYRADDSLRPMDELVRADTVPDGKWHPSIHMFRRDSRITLEVTEVRVERVQDISYADALAEGVSDMVPTLNFMGLWNIINEKRGFGWDTNPWVWAVSFKLVTPGAQP